MIQLRPTPETPAKVRQVLAAAGVRANVAKQRFACRVVVLSWADRARAVARADEPAEPLPQAQGCLREVELAERIVVALRTTLHERIVRIRTHS